MAVDMKLNLLHASRCEMFTFCDVLHEAQQKKRKQTLESAQYGLEIILKAQPLLCTYKYMIQHNKSEVLKSKNKLALKMRN